MNLYQENILDHYKHPRNFGELEDAVIQIEGANVFCGDEIKFFLNLNRDEQIVKVAWTGKACAVCTASASMLSEQIISKSLKEIKSLQKETIIDNLGIELSPTRLKCALLPLETLKKI